MIYVPFKDIELAQVLSGKQEIGPARLSTPWIIACPDFTLGSAEALLQWGLFFQTVTSRCSGDLSNSVHMGHFPLVSSDCGLFTQLNLKIISITQEGKDTIEFLTIVNN